MLRFNALLISLTLAGRDSTVRFGFVAGTETNVSETTEQRKTRAGFGYGLGAYTMWEVFPLYFRTLTHVSPWVIIGHRILWSALFLSVVVSIRREWLLVLPVVGQHR